MLNLGGDIKLPDGVNEIPKTVIVGQNGSGKTNLMRVIFQELEKAGYTVIVFDKLNNYYSMTPNFFGKGDIEKLSTNDLVRAILETKESTVIDFLTIGKKDRIEFIDRFIESYTNLKNKIAKSLKVAFLIDEVQNFLPQFGKTSERLMEFYTEARNFNTIFVVGGTRFASVHKEIVENANNVLILRTKFKNSLDVIKSLLKYELDKKELSNALNKIQNLEVGEVLLWSSGERGA